MIQFCRKYTCVHCTSVHEENHVFLTLLQRISYETQRRLHLNAKALLCKKNNWVVSVELRSPESTQISTYKRIDTSKPARSLCDNHEVFTPK